VPLRSLNKQLMKLDEHSKRVGLALKLALEELICKPNGGGGCTELFVKNPGKLRDLLLEYYEGSVESVKFLIKEMYIVPLLILAEEKSYGREDSLSELFVKDPEAFKKEVGRLLEKIR
jgi:hypothetical protein